MSRVYFHSPSGTTEILGSERAYMSGVIEDITCGFVASDIRYEHGRQRYVDLLPADSYLRRMNGDGDSFWQNSFLTAWRVGMSLSYKGLMLDTFTLSLNTAVLVGDAPIRLLARIHAQCEIHGYILGPDRSEIADVIDAGLERSIYRRDSGLEELATFLRSSDSEPVVTSYSVTEGFPNCLVGDWMPPWPEGVKSWDELPEDVQQTRTDRSEAWYDLSKEEQWKISYAGVEDTPNLRPISVASLGEKFGHNLSVFDLAAPDWEQRLQRLTADDSVLEDATL